MSVQCCSVLPRPLAKCLQRALGGALSCVAAQGCAGPRSLAGENAWRLSGAFATGCGAVAAIDRRYSVGCEGLSLGWLWEPVHPVCLGSGRIGDQGLQRRCEVGRIGPATPVVATR